MAPEIYYRNVWCGACERGRFLTTGSYPTKERAIKDFASREYWAGWILAYYQWLKRSKVFRYAENGLFLVRGALLYILHEADQSKFVDTANEIISRHKLEKPSNLTTIRKQEGLRRGSLQSSLGVALRMIQLYEQRQNELTRHRQARCSAWQKHWGCEMSRFDGVRRIMNGQNREKIVLQMDLLPFDKRKKIHNFF
jgi:DNA-binding transcriptional regulator YiaG